MEQWKIAKENNGLYNADFFSELNNKWYANILENYRYTQPKPIVFLPCARGKPISKSRTHCYLSAITRDDAFEKIIISEPLVLIPYYLEAEAPLYEYAPKFLKKKKIYRSVVADLYELQHNESLDKTTYESEAWRDRHTFIRRLSIFFFNLKERNPSRHNLYYIGSKHHYFILRDAIRCSGNLFNLIYEIPPRGIRDYSSSAKHFAEVIKTQEGIIYGN